jgi:hypothetical protein
VPRVIPPPESGSSRCSAELIFYVRGPLLALSVSNMGASLYEPINVYKPIAPDIGIVDGPFEYLTVGGIRLPLPFTTRMTVVRLSNGDLVLHSPVKFDERLAKELHKLGTVRHLVSPNQFHYAHIGEWARASRKRFRGHHHLCANGHGPGTRTSASQESGRPDF